MSELSHAVRQGNVETVRQLIDYLRSQTLSLSDGYNLLCDSTKYNHPEVTKLLLSKGSRVNKKSQRPSETPLHFAATNGDIEIVQMLLNRGANIAAKNYYSRTPFHRAVENEKLEVTKLLLTRGVEINAKDDEGVTPLYESALHLKTDILKILLDEGANIHEVNNSGRTALHQAVENENMVAAELLVNHGANVNVQDMHGVTPLYLAADSNYLEIIKYLLNHGANVNVQDMHGVTPLYLAADSNYLEMIKYLLNHGANVNVQDMHGVTPLYLAADSNYLEMIKYLLKHGANVNLAYTSTVANGFTPLHDAAKKGYPQVVQLLLKSGANVHSEDEGGKTVLQTTVLSKCKQSDDNIKAEIAGLCIRIGGASLTRSEYGSTILHDAACEGLVQTVKTLLDNSAQVNAISLHSGRKGGTPLHVSARHGYIEVVKILLQYGADIDLIDKDGTGALAATILSNNVSSDRKAEIVELLISKGASLASVVCYRSSRIGSTLLHLSAYADEPKIIQLVLKLGADIHCKDQHGRTPLHAAAEFGNARAVKTLLEHNGDVNSRNCRGLTPLHEAAQEGHSKVVQVLLENNTDVNFISTRGETPLHFIAKKSYLHRGHYDCFKILLKFGAEMPKSDLVNPKRMDWLRKCEEEMRLMNGAISENINVSFSDIFTKNLNQLANYAKNEDIIQVLQLGNCKRLFPLYGHMLHKNFKKGVNRRNLLERSNHFFCSVSTALNLPSICIEKIHSYLDDEDLKSLINCSTI